MFGLVWPAGLALAEAMTGFGSPGQRILEVGCGLGLASLVLQRAGADITATDHHPLAGDFLRFNAFLNRLAPIVFRRASWAEPNDGLGRFDVVIASDVLYESDHPDALLGFIDRHTHPSAEVIVADPGRSQRTRFGARMRGEGYAQHDERVLLAGDDTVRRGRIMRFQRTGLVPSPPPAPVTAADGPA